MFDYDKKNPVRVKFIRLLDRLNLFKKHRCISSVLYLDIKDEPRIVLLQQVLNTFSGNGWEVATVLKGFDSNFLDMNAYVFKKKVGYFEYKYYSKILNKATDETIKKMKEFVKSANNVKNIVNPKGKNQNNFSLDKFRVCKNNKDKNIFFKNIYDNSGGNE